MKKNTPFKLDKNLLKRFSWVGFVALVALGALYSYLASPRPAPAPSGSPSPTLVASEVPAVTVPTPLPTTAPSEAIFTQPFLLASLDGASQTIFFLDPDSQELKRYNLVTKETTVLMQAPQFLERLAWSPRHTKLLFATRDEAAQGEVSERPIRLASFDIASGRRANLNPNIQAISFLTEEKIIYQFRDRQYNNLSIANTDGTDWKNIASLTGDVSILGTGKVALVQTEGSKDITRYSAGGERLNAFSIPPELILSQSVWNEDGTSALYWLLQDGQTLVKYFRAGQTETVVTVPGDILIVLWDNKSGDIYGASFDGLKKIGQRLP